jgi:hypothetical protein
MKVRVVPAKASIYDNSGFFLQEKKWYGWKNIYHAMLIKYILEYIHDLREVRNVEIVK